MKTISKTLLSAIILASCNGCNNNNKIIEPKKYVSPVIPIFCEPIKIDYLIRKNLLTSQKKVGQT